MADRSNVPRRPTPTMVSPRPFSDYPAFLYRQSDNFIVKHNDDSTYSPTDGLMDPPYKWTYSLLLARGYCTIPNPAVPLDNLVGLDNKIKAMAEKLEPARKSVAKCSTQACMHLDQLTLLTVVTCDGDLISKSDRDDLVKLGLVDRIDGWNFITAKGVRTLAALGILHA